MREVEKSRNTVTWSKAPQFRSTFGGCVAKQMPAPVARSTCPSQKVKSISKHLRIGALATICRPGAIGALSFWKCSFKIQARALKTSCQMPSALKTWTNHLTQCPQINVVVSSVLQIPSANWAIKWSANIHLPRAHGHFRSSSHCSQCSSMQRHKAGSPRNN